MARWALTSGAARWTRGAVVGLLTVLLGTFAHVAAGGHLPPMAVALGLTAATTGLAVLLSGTRWSASSLLGLFLLAQTGVHLASMSAGPHGSMLEPLMVGTHVGAAALLVLVVLQGEHALLALLDLVLPRALRSGIVTLAAPRPLLILRPATVVVPRWVPDALLGRAPPLAA